MGALSGLRALALVLLAAISLFTAESQFAQPLRFAVFDAYQRWFPLKRKLAPVRVVVIDEKTIAALGQWPWPRTRMADLVNRIAAYQPLAIGLDLIFPEPDRLSPEAMLDELPFLPSSVKRILQGLPTNDDRFAEAIVKSDVVLGISAETVADARFPRAPRPSPVVITENAAGKLRSYPGHIASIDPMDGAAAGRGVMNSTQERVIRQAPLLAIVQGTPVPSLAVETFRVAVAEPVRVSPLGSGLATLSVGQWQVPMQDDGHTWIRFSPYEPDKIAISALTVMSREAPLDALKDHIVLVGVSGLGVLDYQATARGEFVPGVFIHAQVIENLYNKVALVRPDWAPRAEAAALVLFGLLLVVFVPRLSALQSINAAIAMIVLLAGTGLIAFVYFSLLLDPLWPIIGILAVFVSVVVGALSRSEGQRRLLREEAAHMAGEVDAARRIQMGLLPDPDEVLPQDRRFSLAATLEPARTVGGDFYDCFMVDENRLFFIVADVSGKGLPAALFMAAAKAHLKSTAVREREVGVVLTRAQDEIERENPEQLFVTAFAGALDVQTGILEYTNAGHEPPFRRTPAGKPERFGMPVGPPLCVVEDFVYPTERLQLEAGQWVVLVTDGATEAMNPAREFFGLERLRTSLAWMPRESSAKELIRKLNEDVKKFAAGAEPADDLTLMALRWEGGGASQGKVLSER